MIKPSYDFDQVLDEIHTSTPERYFEPDRRKNQKVIGGAVILAVVVTVGYAVWRLMQMI